MTVSIKISGIREVLKFLRFKKREVSDGEKKGLFKAATFVQGEVKSSIAGRRAEPTSVDTGRFLNSVDLHVGQTDAVIFSDIPYGKFLEFGTSTFSGRRHFNNTKARTRGKVKDIIKREIDKSI